MSLPSSSSSELGHIHIAEEFREDYLDYLCGLGMVEAVRVSDGIVVRKEDVEKYLKAYEKVVKEGKISNRFREAENEEVEGFIIDAGSIMLLRRRRG